MWIRSTSRMNRGTSNVQPTDETFTFSIFFTTATTNIRPIRLSYKSYFFSQRTLFFSRNKSTNSIFNHDFSAKWTAWPRSAGIISRLKNTVGWFFVREKYCSGWKNKLNKTNYKPDKQTHDIKCMDGRLQQFIKATRRRLAPESSCSW
jgi:hypothetical protein